MTQQILARRLRARLHGERGFTIIETVVALGVVFASLATVAYTVTAGLNYIGYSRSRVQATGLANEVIEEIRALPYSTIRRGLSSTDLTGDSNIVWCATEYRYPSCSGEKLVISTFSGGYAADWIVPHSGTLDLDGLTADWATYVTNPDPSTNPYTVTVVVTWTGGALSDSPSNIVQLQTKFWSPTGCVSSALHPFAAPCQPFFYGLAQAPAGEIKITGDLHLGWVDFIEGRIDLVGAEASGQQEQLSEAGSTVFGSGAHIDDSAGTESEGAEIVTNEADTDPGSPTGDEAGSTLSGAGAALERLQPDCCDEIGIRLTAPAGDIGDANAASAATAADTYPCPPEGTRETDALLCGGSRVRQTGTITAELPFTHVVDTLGNANLVRVTAPASYSTAVVDRDAVAGYQGIVDVTVNRYLGNIYLGGFPWSGMTAPAGMSAMSTADNNYCVRITGFTDTARAIAGERSPTDPSNSIGGTVYYYNGAGFSSKTVTDSTLGTLAVTCETTQTIGGSSVTWRVQVLAGGFTAGAVPAPTQTADPGDSQTRYEADATTTPVKVVLHYYLIVDGAYEMDLVVTTDLGSLLASAAYGAPPPTTGG
jgi:type II secretory pathway pseudopilin PulG